MSGTCEFHTIVVRVENKAGVLARIAGLFSRRGFNIESLAVAPTEDDAFSRITIVVDVSSTSIDQVVKQLDKLINVLENEPTSVERVSDAIFKDYIVAFEAISVLLLAALIGAIVVARKE